MTRIRIAEHRLPTSYINNQDMADLGIQAEALIRIRGPRQPAALLLVFDKPASLQAFWSRAFGSELGNACGAVRPHWCDIEDYSIPGKTRTWAEVDKNLVCTIGLCRTHLTSEIIAHEACHAGFAHAARFKPGIWDDSGSEEEDVCYPTGLLTSAINDFVHEKGFL